MHILFIIRSFIAQTNNYNENVKNQTHLEINEKKTLKYRKKIYVRKLN